MIAADKHQFVIGVPGAGADILQTPGFGEFSSRAEFCVIGNSFADEGSLVAGLGCGSWRCFRHGCHCRRIGRIRRLSCKRHERCLGGPGCLLGLSYRVLDLPGLHGLSRISGDLIIDGLNGKRKTQAALTAINITTAIIKFFRFILPPPGLLIFARSIKRLDKIVSLYKRKT